MIVVKVKTDAKTVVMIDHRSLGKLIKKSVRHFPNSGWMGVREVLQE